MKILYISPRQAWPPLTGAKLRDYYLARSLGNCSELTYVFFAQPGTTAPTVREMPFCREVVAVGRPRPYTPSNILLGLLGRWSLPILNYTSPAMQDVLRRIARHRRFDLVHVEGLHLAATVSAVEASFPGARIVYDWHNIESEAMQRYGERAGNSLRKMYAGITAQRMAAAEASILKTAFGHLVCSERERQLLSAVAPNARIEVIENGVDTAVFHGTVRANGARNRIVFVGSMNYHANVEAAVSFAQRIWPRIHERFPEWRLILVGCEPSPEVLALGKLAGIEVTGTVPDVRQYYRESVAAIVPLRAGGGTRLKILEAMAAGVPVVSTPIGAEGLAVSNSRDILLVDHDEEWLPALATLHADGPRWRELADAGRQLVRSRYDWDMVGQKLFRMYQQWAALPQQS
jgi:glycosyltransferase involved in cell wall biosynthesis